MAMAALIFVAFYGLPRLLNLAPNSDVNLFQLRGDFKKVFSLTQDYWPDGQPIRTWFVSLGFP